MRISDWSSDVCSSDLEHDPEDLWTTTLATCREVMAKAKVTAAEVAGIGITNQRETTVVWDRETGKAVHNALVWQDRRTADLCARLTREGNEAGIGRGPWRGRGSQCSSRGAPSQ